MKKYILLLIMVVASKCYCAESLMQIGAPKGLVDSISPDSLTAEYTPDCQNVLFDDVMGSVVKRTGTLAYNSTPITNSQWIRRLYSYDKINGDKYIIANSSAGVFSSIGDTSFIQIISTQSMTSNYNFSTGEDFLLGTNGVNSPFDYNGTTTTILTIANSTNVPVGKYNVYWHNRWWIANISGLTSRVYYSEVGDHRNFDSANLNYISINVSDGQQITGMFIYNDNLYVTKERSTWQIYSVSPANPDTLTDEVFDARIISFDIGCLYQSSMLTYKGLYPMWLSHRGFELFDGQFSLASEKIDRQVKGLRQLNISNANLIQTSASDWGAGSGANIDTTTYSGSVAISQLFTVSSGVANSNSFNAYAKKQYFCPSKNITTNVVYIDLINPFSGPYFGIYTSTNGVVSEVEIYNPTNMVTLSNTVTLNSGTTYYIYMGYGSYYDRYSGTTIFYQNKINTTNISNNNCTGYMQYTDSGGSSAIYKTTDVYMSFGFRDYNLSASYTTQSINAGSSWGQWGTFSVDNTVPSSSTISYMIKTSTASDNLSSKTASSITNGQAISSADGPYIQVISSFTRTDATAIPLLNEIKINYQASSNVEPIGVSYHDRAYFAVDTGSGYNDALLVYDSNGEWSKHTGNVGSACLYSNRLITGDSTNTGLIYYNDVENVYTDNGVNYNAYFTSPVINFETRIQEKLFKELWVTAKNEANGSIDIYYKLYGNDASYTQFSKSLDLYSSINSMVVGKYVFPLNTRSYYMQYKIGSTNSTPFQVRAIDLIYEILPRR